MKTSLIFFACLVTLASCSWSSEKEGEKIPAEILSGTNLPENAKMIPGYTYPAVPLDQYQTGTDMSGVTK